MSRLLSLFFVLLCNEIYARHGRPFQDPTLRGYFRERSWYYERPDFRDSDLSPRERRNALFLLGQEKKRGTKF